MTTTTMGASHGEARQCASCGLTYNYPGAKTFTCLSCHLEQPWHAPATGPANSVQRQTAQHQALVEQPVLETPPEIPLVNVLRSLNSMSSDGIDQVYKRLTILHLAHEANCWRGPEREYYAAVVRVLSGVGVQL